MVKGLRLQVLTPAETLLDVAEVSWVHLQLADGLGISIYPGHAPLLAETATAPLRYADSTGEHTLDLEAGILEVSGAGEVVLFTSGLAQAQGIPGSPRFERLTKALLGSEIIKVRSWRLQG